MRASGTVTATILLSWFGFTASAPAQAQCHAPASVPARLRNAQCFGHGNCHCTQRVAMKGNEGLITRTHQRRSDCVCVCSKGWEGPSCSFATNSTLVPGCPQNCNLGGSCWTLSDGSHKCQCFPGYRGASCSHRCGTCAAHTECTPAQ